MKCIVCNNKLTGRQEKFCSRKCKNKTSNYNHQIYEAQQKRGLSRKLELIKLLGGCCSKCQYNKNIAALSFHHIDPSKKTIKLDMRNLSNKSWQTCLNEAKKCELLCHNCHMELHHPTLSINLLSN